MNTVTTTSAGHYKVTNKAGEVIATAYFSGRHANSHFAPTAAIFYKDSRGRVETSYCYAAAFKNYLKTIA